MSFYLDSSALVKLYYPEKESDQLAQWVLSNDEALPFTSLHELELTNAFSLKVFRKEITKAQRKALLEILKKDEREGILERAHPNWGEVFAQAIQWSEQQTLFSGCRSLDVLHVSLANILHFNGFLTFDGRQAKLAKKVGLKVISF